jgi:hypothetical protein
LGLIARTEPQRALARSEAATAVPVLKKNEAAAVLSPWFANLMNGLSNQVQIAVSEIAAVTLANEKKRLLDEFRCQIQNEATGTIANECNGKMLELSQVFEKMARDSAQNMIASATNEGNKNLEQRAAEISGRFTDQLEGHVRNYLEFIGESIKEFPKKPPAA